MVGKFGGFTAKTHLAKENLMNSFNSQSKNNPYL